MSRLDRRRFLATLGAAAGAAAMTPAEAAARALRGLPGPSPRTLILVNLQGGYDALSMLPPITGSRATVYQGMRPSLAWVPGSATPPLALPGVSDFGLHPQLGLFASLYGAGDLAIVQKTGLPIEQRSHFAARRVMARGRADLTTNPDHRGWLGRLADAGLNTPLDIVGVGGGLNTEFVANGPAPVAIDRLADFNEDEFGVARERDYRRDVLRQITTQTHAGENRIRRSLRVVSTQAHDLAEMLQTSTAGINLIGNYPDSNDEKLSGRLQDVAKLMIASPATRIFLTSTGEFDTHGNEESTGATNKPTLSSRLQNVTQTLQAFITDLQSSALNRWNDTAIVVYTEFGRRNPENNTGGTDHAHGYHTFVLGGGVLGGLKGNKVSTADLNAANEALPAQIDYRTVLFKCLVDWLQLPVSTANAVFDDYTQSPGEPGFALF